MKRSLALVIFLIFVVWWMPVYACATNLGEITENMILKTNAQTDLYQEASEHSMLIISLEAGTVVFTIESAMNDWCKISVGEYTGYVRIEKLTTIGNQELIKQELEQNINHDYVDAEEFQQMQEQKLQTGLWGKVMLVLVITVLMGSGIYIKFQTNKEAQE